MSKRNGKRFGLIFLALVVLAAFGIKVAASAQPGLTDFDVVAINAEVMGAMNVDAGGQTIELGILTQGFEFDVPADGTSGEVATFLISGPAGLDWDLTVEWDDLDGPGDEVIVVAPPDGNDICFDPTGGTACTTTINTDETITSAQHGGGGQANVGYSISVPINATAGIYDNLEAITLTAEALLGSGG